MIVRFGRRDDTFFTAWFWLARRIGPHATGGRVGWQGNDME